MASQNPVSPLTEVVEAEGHLIDSHIMEHIFDTVVEYRAASKWSSSTSGAPTASRRTCA